MKNLGKSAIVLLFIVTIVHVALIAFHHNADGGYICEDSSNSIGMTLDIIDEISQGTEDAIYPLRTPQPRLRVPDHYPDDACHHLPIASGYLYYVAIGDAIFQIQDQLDFEFTPPAHAEFVYMGTASQVRDWESSLGRLPATIKGHMMFYDETLFVIIDLYDHGNNYISSVMHWNPYSNLDPELDEVRFIGTWNQIRVYDIVDLQQLDRNLHATIDPYDIYHVRFSGSWGAWAIQNARDWDFVKPSYVEVETEFVELEDDAYEESRMVITFILLDEQRNTLGQHVTRIGFLYADDLPIPTFTGAYTVGTLAELGGIGS